MNPLWGPRVPQMTTPFPRYASASIRLRGTICTVLNSNSNAKMDPHNGSVVNHAVIANRRSRVGLIFFRSNGLRSTRRAIRRTHKSRVGFFRFVSFRGLCGNNQARSATRESLPRGERVVISSFAGAIVSQETCAASNRALTTHSMSGTSWMDCLSGYRKPVFRKVPFWRWSLNRLPFILLLSSFCLLQHAK